MKSLVRFFATEHIFGNVLTIVAVVLGILALSSIRREVWPPVDFETVTVTAVLAGASPEQVEKLVTNPIEDALRDVDGLKEVFSSATESTSITVITLDPDTKSTQELYTDIKDEIDAVTDFPEEMEDPVVTLRDTTKNPVLNIVVSGSLSPLELRKQAKFIIDELRLMDEVASITKNGYYDREFIITADPKKMAQRRVSITDIVNAVKTRNVSFPAGSIKLKSQREVLLRTDAEYQTQEDILDTVVSANEAGFGTKLRQIARVTEGLDEEDIRYRVNGESAINLTILKKKSADVITLSDKLKSEVKRLQAVVPEGVRITIANDLSKYVRTRMSVLSSNFFIGLILVFIVLALFLPQRVTLVVGIGIPVALLATILVADQLGLSLNLLSMIGLIIVLGMVVDDAIVVCENVWRYYEQGLKPVDAITAGVTEVSAPVLASVLTTVGAFSAFFLMSGIMGKFIFEIPLMVCLTLFFSLFEVMLIVPSHFNSWVPAKVVDKHMQKKQAKDSHWFDRLIDSYKKYVEWTLGHKYKIFAGSVVFFSVLLGIIVSQSKFILFPPEGVENFFIRLEAPKDSPIEVTERNLAKVEVFVNELPKDELRDSISTIGIQRMAPSDPNTKRGSQYAMIQVILTPESERKRSAQEIIEELKTKIQTPKGFEKVSYSLAQGGPPVGSPISVNVLGDKFKDIQNIASRIEDALTGIKGVREIENSYVEGKEEVLIKPLDLESRVLGLSPQDISLSMQASFEGIIASSLRELDEEINIRVKLRESDDEVDRQLQDVSIGNRQGNLIPIRNVASFESTKSLNSILHYDFKRLINVSADVDTEKNTVVNVNKQMQENLKDQILREEKEKLSPIQKLTKFFNILMGKEKFESEIVFALKENPAIKISLGGENKDTQESMASLFRAFALAVIGIYFLLLMVFRTFFQPFLALSVIVMGVFGSILALMLHGRPLSFMSMLGVVALSGVIVNNAIVMIDFINSRKKKGLNEKLAIVDSASTRFRPIVMTTVTTVVGLIPTAYGLGGSDPFIKPLALSFGWGLVIGVIFILLLFPSLIAIHDDFVRIPEFLKRRKA